MSKSELNFTSIDFETATGKRNSACQIGVVKVVAGEIVREWSAMIKPPNNYYNQRNVDVHGINSIKTFSRGSFEVYFDRIKELLEGETLVAHNYRFDKSVLESTMEYYGLDYSSLNIKNWECTLDIYRSKGVSPCKLSDCAKLHNLELDHHEALSDARVSAQLYIIHKSNEDV